MDYLKIEDLEVFAHHGVFAEEKKLGQKFLISLKLHLNMRKAAISEDLNQSVHYGELCHAIEKEFQKETYDLIETAGEKLAHYVLHYYQAVQGISITIKKPWAPILRSLDTVSIEINREWHVAYIGMGSNLGDPSENLKKALLALSETPEIKILQESTTIETPPWGYEDQDPFLNKIIKIKTFLAPDELLSHLLSIEKNLKRERLIRFGPRTIDLDILFYEALIIHTPDLILPHPRLHLREFVLESMVEIAPYLIHPVKHLNMLELLEHLSTNVS